MTRVTKKPEVRKQEILDTAIQLFFEKGYEKTTISDIAKRMNVSQGLCYRYFSSKEEIYHGVLDHYVSQGVQQFELLLGDETMTLAQTIEQLRPLKGETQSESYYHKFFNLSENLALHIQMEFRLLSALVPIMEKRLLKAKENGEINCNSIQEAAAFLLFGQFGVALASEKDEQQTFEINKEFIKKFLGVY
ncbi:TetR/AcrR family transcriptional regulator [Enterococcus sp. AZ109]|uniref:TetR/AcrR family transcriptional regulator n=1 Tax=Enterococcus sp. AZ109 TaxID=2774634 RepID=UPI003F223E19